MAFDDDGPLPRTERCWGCNGSGLLHDDPCTICGGWGSLKLVFDQRMGVEGGATASNDLIFEPAEYAVRVRVYQMRFRGKRVWIGHIAVMDNTRKDAVVMGFSDTKLAELTAILNRAEKTIAAIDSADPPLTAATAPN